MTRTPKEGRVDLVRDDVRALTLYEESAPPGSLDLSANTNLFGPNPAVGRALARARADSFSEYPTLQSASFRRAVAEAHGVAEDMVVTGNGSNELIDVLVRTFADAGETVAYHPPSFSMIPVFVRANGAEAVPVPLLKDFELDVDGLLDAAAKVTVVCRPNNPTGNAFPRKAVERLVELADGLVVVDEAYGEFLEGRSFVPDVAERDNLVVLRTMSKAHGLAGLRVGYAVAPPALARELGKVRGPFRLNAFSELAACLALADPQYAKEVVAGVRAERPRLARLLQQHAFKVYPSDANFVLVRPPVDARAVARAFAARGVVVRDFGGDLAPFLRLTVGPPAVTARLTSMLDDVIADARRATGGA